MEPVPGVRGRELVEVWEEAGAPAGEEWAAIGPEPVRLDIVSAPILTVERAFLTSEAHPVIQ